MTLFVRSFGAGSDVVLLHGWGFHGAIWDAFAETLVDWGHRVHVVDLPGHGQSPPLGTPMSIDAVAMAVQEVVPVGAVWVGWSLGGMVALARAALVGVRALVMIAASPRFVREPDWPCAMDPALLAEFGDGLNLNWRMTLTRFLAIQARSVAGEDVRRLRTLMFNLPPDPVALAEGLSLLRSADLRVCLRAVHCPTLVLLGERDTLVPIELSAHLLRLRPDWRVHGLSGAGHLPFLTHQAEVLSILAEFLAKIDAVLAGQQ